VSSSPNLGLQYGFALGFSPWKTEADANAREIDSLVMCSVLEIGTETPPGGPAEGDRYVLGATPTGAWVGEGGKLAAYVDATWRFFTPKRGWVAWNNDDLRLYVYSDHETTPAWYPITAAL